MINLAFWNKPDPDKPKQNGFEKYGEKYINENFLQDVDRSIGLASVRTSSCLHHLSLAMIPRPYIMN